MQNFILGCFGLFGTILATVQSAKPANPDHVRQLLQTNNCPGCDLTDMRFANLNLQNADLSGANLTNAHFFNSQLIRANLSQADLSEAQLFGTNLTGANLQSANLTGVEIFSPCTIEDGTSEDRADCVTELMVLTLGPELCQQEYGLWTSELGADLTDFCTEEGYVDFWLDYGSYHSYHEVNLVHRTTLQGANLANANLTEVDLTGVDLRHANLTNAIATDANLDYALLLHADTTGLIDAPLEAAWLTPDILGRWLINQFTDTTERARNAEATTYVGAMNRGQQAYYLENSKFSDNLSDLGLGIANETEHYYYRIALLSNGGVMNYADPKADGQTPYLGGVFIDSSGDYKVSVTVLCEPSTVDAVFAPPLPPAGPEQRPQCPNNWQER